jgi:hypothetical protein
MQSCILDIDGQSNTTHALYLHFGHSPKTVEGGPQSVYLTSLSALNELALEVVRTSNDGEMSSRPVCLGSDGDLFTRILGLTACVLESCEFVIGELEVEGSNLQSQCPCYSPSHE